MISIRRARSDEFGLVRHFYSEEGYGGTVTSAAAVFVAETEADTGDELVGVVRLELEHGLWVLRGMNVRRMQQRQGVGTSLLHALVATLGDRECYCIPYVHLRQFYGQAGFAEIPLDAAPEFLCARSDEYRARGFDVTIMHRAATGGGRGASQLAIGSNE